MTTAWLLIVPMPLELMLPLMTLSQPTPTSMLQGDSAGVVCACAAGANPIHAATEVSTTKDFQVLGVIWALLYTGQRATSGPRTGAAGGDAIAAHCSETVSRPPVRGVRLRDAVTASPPVVTSPPAVSGSCE